MKGRLETEHHTDATWRSLEANLHSLLPGRVGPCDDASPLFAVSQSLQERNAHRSTASVDGHLFEHIELGVEAARILSHVEVTDRLQYTPTELTERTRDAGQLRVRRFGRGRVATIAGPVIIGAPRAESDRTLRHRLAGQARHLGDLFGRRLDRRQRAITHHINAQGIVGHLNRKVDRMGKVDGIHVLGERLPPPVDAFRERGAGDVLDPLHQIDETLPIHGPNRSKSDAAVPHHHRRDPVKDARGEIGIPRHLAVVVGMDVDESRRHEQARRVEHTSGLPLTITDRDDAAVGDGDIGATRGRPGAVHNGTAADHFATPRSGSLGVQRDAERL